MKAFCLGITILFFSFFTKAQNAVAPGFDQTNYPQFAVNLAVLGSATNSADSYFEEAERYERVGDFESAVAMFNRAAATYQNHKKFGRYGVTLLRLSNTYVSLANYNEAEQLVLKKALRNYTKIGSKAGQMACYQQLGKVYMAANKLPQSLWFYTQHGMLALQLNNKNAYIESVLGIAAIKIKKKEYLLASKDLNTAQLLSITANIIQYNQLIKTSKALIAERTSFKKG